MTIVELLLNKISIESTFPIEPVIDPNDPTRQIIKDILNDRFEKFIQDQPPYQAISVSTLTINRVQLENQPPLYLIGPAEDIKNARYVGIQQNPTEGYHEHVIATGESPQGQPLYQTAPVDLVQHRLSGVDSFIGTRSLMGSTNLYHQDGSPVDFFSPWSTPQVSTKFEALFIGTIGHAANALGSGAFAVVAEPLLNS